ncbi:MAG: replication initiation factor domain-containing protein, partial [Thaumarchaeota archaeon]|nr:replication initiation factor domain-containing protein [Nitrososphaerota archaeon]
KDNGSILLSSLRPYLDNLGCSVLNDGCVQAPSGGLLLHGNRGRITWIEAKGQFVASLRAFGVLNDFLAVVSEGPHRVTRADLAVDEYVDSPAKRVQGIYALAKSGGISFSRKALQHSQIGSVFGPTLYDDTGLDTGTVYLGKRSAEVRGRVYDKTQERASKGECIGLTVRHEMSITSKMGISLKDIASPQSCFYHFYPSEVLSTPQTEPWVPGGEGFFLKRSSEALPAQRLKQRVESSPDIGSLIGLAQECGPEGMHLLHRLIEERARKDGYIFTPLH